MEMHEAVPPIPAGEIRRDCEPHRATFLQGLGALSMLLGAMAVCLFVPGLIGFPLGVWVWVAARGDTEKMHLGLMDPEGRGQTDTARAWAVNALVLSVLSWLVWGLLFYQGWLDG